MMNAFLRIDRLAGLAQLALLLLLGSFSAVASDTNIIAWPSGSLMIVPPMGTNVIAITGGDTHAIALLADRTVRTWGYFWLGGSIAPPADATNVVGIASGSTHAVAVRSDGKVVLWGTVLGNYSDQVPPEATNVVAVGVGPGAQHVLALRKDGTVVDWGLSATTNIPPGVVNIVSVAAGDHYSLALRSDGRLFEWGATLPPPSSVTSATNIVAIATTWTSIIALRADGTLLPVGISMPNLTNIVEVAGSSGGSMALDGNGTVFASGAPATATNIMAIGGAGGPQAGSGSGTYFAVKAAGPPIFPLPAVRRTVAAEQTAFLRLRAVGALPMSYQWMFHGTNLPGATRELLVVTNAMPGDAGFYSLVASNALGGITNSDMELVVAPLVITNQPSDVVTNADATVQLNVGVLGQGPFSYQWLCNGTNISWGTNSSLTLTNIQLTDGGAYSVSISNSYGAVTSSTAHLSVWPVLITSQPQPTNQAVYVGASPTLSVAVLGESPSYQWWVHKATSIAGATNSSLTITNIQLTDAGTYRVTISNAFGMVTSSTAYISVWPVLITSQPQPTNQAVYVGASPTLSVTVQGESPSYQWLLNGTNIAWATNSSLTVTNIQLSDAGTYSVSVSNVYGVVTSSPAFISVWPILVTQPPQDQVIFRGGTVAFSITAQASSPLSYQWLFNDTILPDTDTNTLTLTNVLYQQAGAYTVITSTTNAVVTNAASLSVVPVAAWGDNFSGVTSIPTDLTNVLSLASGAFHGLALRGDDTVTAWGDNRYGQSDVPSDLTGVVALAGGYQHSLALRTDGTLAAWGRNDCGQANVLLGLSNVVACAGGWAHTLALTADGSIAAWGDNTYGQSSVPAGLGKVSAIATSYFHNLVLTEDGSVVAWGQNNYGQTNVPSDLTNAVAVAAGEYHSLALRTDGIVVAWGNNSYGQATVPTGLTNVVAIAAGFWHNLALRADGTVAVWGDNSYGQTNLPSGLTNVVAISAGGIHSYALIGDGPPVVNGLPVNPVWSNHVFSVSLVSQNNHVYRLEHKDNLSDSAWVANSLVAGTGGPLTFTDPTATGSQRFYRIRRW